MSAFDDTLKFLVPAWVDLKKHPYKATKGSDGQSIESFQKRESQHIKLLRSQLIDGSFSFSPVRIQSIRSGEKNREILISTITDRIVAKALLAAVRPQFSKYHSSSSYCPISKSNTTEYTGVPRAAMAIQGYLDEGFIYALKGDIIKFFDNVPKESLLQTIRKEIRSPKVMRLIIEIINFKKYLDPAFVGDKKYSTINGIAQGSPLSPLFADVYLYQFDQEIQKNKNRKLIRYVDDFVILCKTKEDAENAYTTAQSKLEELGLSMHPLEPGSKTAIVKMKGRVEGRHQPLHFLGLVFTFKTITVPKEKTKKIILELRAMSKEGRKNEDKIHSIQRKAQGFIAHYNQKHYATSQSIRAVECATMNIIVSLIEKEYHLLFRRRMFPFTASQELKLEFLKKTGILHLHN